MPTYEYACKSCGEHLEVVQSFKDSALTECPACGGALRKVFGNIGVTFKGSGFYKTDSRSEGRKASAGAGASRGTDGSSSHKEGSGNDGAGGSSSGGSSSKGDGAGTSSTSSSGGSGGGNGSASSGKVAAAS